ncbi:hypothetical protein CEXT_157851 [Caerostris extrusa]|uniref:Uncharacterized protein n=1 Tax=Caerostris extrusa TaxID=172846 RepID=A0AAV4XUI7_CAEEX|nr:hypothetical protein CEXT_157851 [Caerostris extrusa]
MTLYKSLLTPSPEVITTLFLLKFLKMVSFILFKNDSMKGMEKGLSGTGWGGGWPKNSKKKLPTLSDDGLQSRCQKLSPLLESSTKYERLSF